MSETINCRCTGCNRMLKLPAIHAGRKAKCPACQTILEIPTQPDLVAPEEPGPVAQFQELEPPPPVFTELAPPAEAYPYPVPPDDPPPAPLPSLDEPQSPRPIRPGPTTRRRDKTQFRPAPSGKGPLIAVGVLVLFGVAALVVFVLKNRPKADPTVAGGGSGVASAGTGEPEPSATLSPSEQLRLQLETRAREFVATYNSNNLNRLKDFYQNVTLRDMNYIFVDTLEKYDLKYENLSITDIDINTGAVQIKFDRVRIHKQTRRPEKVPDQKKTLNFEKIDGRWILTCQPEI